EQTERCWSSTATAVKSSTDVHYNIEDESLFMMKKSDGAPVPFDIESIIARTPYLQIRPVANTKNITSSSVAAVRRIPMATVTPDDFHPSATASSSPGPLQTSSPLLPADIDALPDTFGKVLSDFSNRSSCDTPLSFDVEKCQKTATSVTESMSLVDELTAASGCEFSLDAWLTLDKSIEDNHNYAACSKEIKELVQLFS
uniref:Uncharacterized protein n=1 Tax=Plectus sambesii TaxID=2011161 RepID=A0A914XPH5_9BILA